MYHYDRRNSAVDVNFFAFDFVATFDDLKPGRYQFIWKFKLRPEFYIRWGLQFKAKVTYDKDLTDNSGSINAVIPKDLFMDLAKEKWQDVVVKEHIVVQPHRGKASVKLHLKNHESPYKVVEESTRHVDYRNFQISSVEIRPCTTHNNDIYDIHSVSAKPVASLNIKSTVNMWISRISAATEVDLIAVLRHSKDTVYVGIWDFNGVQERSKDSINSLIDCGPKAEAPPLKQEGVHRLPLGISLSPDGKYLAVFQEPLIGGWNSKEEPFKFQVFDTSIKTPKHGEYGNSEVRLDMENMEIGLALSNAASHITSLQNFVGFAKFLPSGGSSTENGESPAKNKKRSQSDDSLIFAACDGIYLDLFDCSQERWNQTHSITLTDLSPSSSVSRRITCQMMMESMGRNTFLWLDSHVCSVWSVKNGANINYLSNENSKTFIHGGDYRSSLKMAISPDESIIAVATNRGSVRTYFASSGIEIRSIKFRTYKIEYLGFLSQFELLVVTRDSTTHEFGSKIFDPIDMRTPRSCKPVPIPTAGTTLLITRRGGATNVEDQTMVCTPTGAVLRFYRVQDTPHDQSTNITNEASYVKHQLSIPVPIDASKNENSSEEPMYKISLIPSKEALENGDERLYWVIGVKVEQTCPNKVLCEFVPEPWMRSLVKEYTNLDDLTSSYFLPCGKRFIIIGFHSIQIWAIPEGDKNELKLLAFWSSPQKDVISPSKGFKFGNYVFGKFQIIESAKVYDDSIMTQVKVQLVDKETPEDVKLPGNSIDTWNYGFIPCCRSIHLIAAAFSYVNEREEFDPHAKALLSFSIQYINRITDINSILGTDDLDDVSVNILTLLIGSPAFKHTSIPFMKMALLSSQGNPWIPREHDRLNPIQKAIQEAVNVKNRDIVESLVNYSLDRAKKYHPSYLTPVIDSLGDLSKHYHDLVEKVFTEASFIKAKNKSYIAANATLVNPQFNFRKFKCNSLEEHTNPVLYLRSQLPCRLNKPSPFDLLFGREPLQHNRIKANPEAIKKKNLHSDLVRDIYVAPFPKLSRYSDKDGKKSAFATIAGTNLIGFPAMIATLRFKWRMFGWKKWAIRFSVVFVFSLLFMIITAMQITANPGHDKYLDGWDPAMYVVIALGCVGLLFEMWQFYLDPKDYIFSPYNYLDLAAFGLPIIGCINLLIVNHEVESDLGPTQIWSNSFALLAVYINLLFELKVFRPLGTAVHILISITKRLLSFMVILAIFMIAFTHAFMHITQTRRNYCANLSGDDLTECQALHPETGYPQDPLRALFATMFFLAGIYDPLSNDIGSSDIGFKILLVLFIFFTVVLMMNVVIAIMNDGYGESRDKGELAWLIQWAQVIVEAEISMMWNSTHDDRQYFPDYIYYGATSRDLEMYSKKETHTSCFGVIKAVNEDVENLMDKRKKLQYLKDVSNHIKNLETQLAPRPGTFENGYSNTFKETNEAEKSGIGSTEHEYTAPDRFKVERSHTV
ncbi:hypothetical protein BGZ49_010019 [Haplosporangium sp. Z 27]|nr:hypothetical protein BGZ49_010019 [Haplosporangium sp. Z 27]